MNGDQHVYIWLRRCQSKLTFEVLPCQKSPTVGDHQTPRPFVDTAKTDTRDQEHNQHHVATKSCQLHRLTSPTLSLAYSVGRLRTFAMRSGVANTQFDTSQTRRKDDHDHHKW